MVEQITAIFPNNELASASINILNDFGLNHSYLENDQELIQDPYLQHKLNQGATIIYFNVHDDQRIAAHEIIYSFAGELYDTNIEVINRMYNIPEESYEKEPEPLIQGNTTESGTLGNPNDQLDDDAYIDPNIGIGNYDLLIPFIEQQEYIEPETH